MSESNKFTSEPWVRSSESPKIIMSGSFIDRRDGYMIGYVTGNDNSGFYASEEEAAANATLMIAAPDLLAALENLLWHAEVLEEFIESERGRGRNADQLYADGEMHNYMVEAKSSISKARGQQ